MYEGDLELLTGTLINDERAIGLLLYKLIEKSEYKLDLINYVNFSSDEELKVKLRGLKENANSDKSEEDTCKVGDIRYSFEEWLNNNRG